MATPNKMNLNNYSKNELEEILSLTYPYTNADIENQSIHMIKNLEKDINLSNTEKENYAIFIGEIKANLMLPLSPKRKTVSELINPIKTKTIIKTINVDTRFRNNYYKTKSSDFTMTLPLVIKNAISLQIQELAVPDVIYTIHRDLKNNFFHTLCPARGETQPMIHKIEDGNYTRTQMAVLLRAQDVSGVVHDPPAWVPSRLFTSGANYRFRIDPLTKKTAISTKDPSGGDEYGDWDIGATQYEMYPNWPGGANNEFSLFFNLREDATSVTDIDTERSLPEGLGWLLGFRYGEYSNSSGYVSEGMFNERSPEYIFMEVDDNQKNINNNFIGAFNSSVLNNNILARLGRGNSPDKSFIPSGTTGRLTRRYFGPVNINKLRIRLLDEFGRVVPMNNMDYSFLLKFECLYEV